MRMDGNAVHGTGSGSRWDLLAEDAPLSTPVPSLHCDCSQQAAGEPIAYRCDGVVIAPQLFIRYGSDSKIEFQCVVEGPTHAILVQERSRRIFSPFGVKR